ncbi:hypothetical protein SAMN04487906_2786 [Zhouia amylolytica]|uniref:DUF5683 domain-containing protein n=1 Tax=Zhouia amylolytica TaxID=376730 RepID=A0A1I6V159_9FLAO|nr:DUF5683 domain-containing protein [Zhouia amylolytica]SFT07418.1 hypothetical protein SAMN04487906_2786 [Zhouia amylolytica]
MLKQLFFLTFLLCLFNTISAQEKKTDTLRVSIDSVQKTFSKRELRRQRRDSIKDANYKLDPLSPSRAAFYSAVLPGLGQAYNKRYWKIPIVYGAIGTGVYFYLENTKQYDRYRDAYKSRLAGFNTDEFWGTDADGNPKNTPDLSEDALRDAQEFYQKNKDLSLLITIGLYALNIIDANVDAHLKQYNMSDDLTLKPYMEINEINFNKNYGLTLTFKF